VLEFDTKKTQELLTMYEIRITMYKMTIRRGLGVPAHSFFIISGCSLVTGAAVYISQELIRLHR
jgi:hypothetical protein